MQESTQDKQSEIYQFNWTKHKLYLSTWAQTEYRAPILLSLDTLHLIKHIQKLAETVVNFSMQWREANVMGLEMSGIWRLNTSTFRMRSRSLLVDACAVCACVWMHAAIRRTLRRRRRLAFIICIVILFWSSCPCSAIVERPHECILVIFGQVQRGRWCNHNTKH